SRNQFGAFSHDGRLVGYSSTRRNGADGDLYVMDPRDPKSDRMVAQVTGGGWSIVDFAPGGGHALVAQYRSVQQSTLYDLDLATGTLRAITDPKAAVAWSGAHYAPDGTLWVIGDQGSDVARLGTLDPATGRFTPVAGDPRWDVEDMEIAPDGRFLVFVVNEAGASRVKGMDLATRAVRPVTGLPDGVASGVRIAP
ncbi:hypothetical protein LTR94_030992, partial [Friedmanniomyces endolithicus]